MLDGGRVFYAHPRTGVYGNLDTSLHQSLKLHKQSVMHKSAQEQEAIRLASERDGGGQAGLSQSCDDTTKGCNWCSSSCLLVG